MTVPVYNLSPGPTNAKTYYLIYQGDAVNTQLTQPSIVEQVGSQALNGEPLTSSPTVTVSGTDVILTDQLSSGIENLINNANAGNGGN
jgi:hypothetical protein